MTKTEGHKFRSLIFHALSPDNILAGDSKDAFQAGDKATGLKCIFAPGMNGAPPASYGLCLF
jgi:hypothetical protein